MKNSSAQIQRSQPLTERTSEANESGATAIRAALTGARVRDWELVVAQALGAIDIAPTAAVGIVTMMHDGAPMSACGSLYNPACCKRSVMPVTLTRALLGHGET
jgi:hypothetical protein